MRLYYAQNKEDLFIKAFFPDITHGFYIDVGANDPVLDSVTRLLYDEGWSGINIEPILRHYRALQQQRPRDVNLNIGLSSKPGKLIFREYVHGDGLSTFDMSMVQQYEADNHSFPTQDFKEYTVSVMTLAQLIAKQHVQHIHFIKIDVEGYEYEVVRGYDWQGVRPELICIEANHVDIHKDWRPFLSERHYREVFFDGVNNYYLAQESLGRQKYFNYPDIAFAGNPVYYPAYQEIEWQVHDADTQYMKPKLEALTERVGEQETQIAFLHRQQRDLHFLAKQLIEELQLRLNKRAKGYVGYDGLIYGPAEAVRQQLSRPVNNPTTLLSFIHSEDKKHITRRQHSLVDSFRPLFWRGAAKGFYVTTVLFKRVAKRLAYGHS